MKPKRFTVYQLAERMASGLGLKRGNIEHDYCRAGFIYGYRAAQRRARKG